MSKIEILQELPKLNAEERREIFERICEMEETALMNGVQPSKEEKEMLDRELEAYRVNRSAGSSWQEVEARLRKIPG